jgi:hypothetical protein
MERSPRTPGQHARAVGLSLSFRLCLIAVGALVVLWVAWAVFDGRGWLLISIELGAIGAMLLANRVYSPQIDRWLQGAEGERQVGAILDRLSGDGWHALHDVSLGRGNVDHMLVGPGGIFTIETKSNRGRIQVDRIDPAMLKQAYAQKKLLERITAYEVQPLLVFSQAWLIGSVPAHRKGVVVLSARMLEGYLARRKPTTAADEAEQVHARLATAVATA